jgi:hypothetical protein
MMKPLIPLCLVALAGCAGGVGAPSGGVTVASCVPVVSQDAMNLHQLEATLAAISASPVTVMPPPVMTQPPPVVVSPSPTGPVIRPAPPGTIVTPPDPSYGPVVTPNARQRHSSPRAQAWPNFDFSGSTFRFDAQGHAEPLAGSQLAAE